MLTILIVDDEKLERNGIKFLLRREEEEFRVLEAGNGKEALGILQKEEVDILFSDVKMPYMTGLELSKAARELSKNLEIVIFSGYNDFSYARDALRYGVVDYVLKPVNPEEFHKTIQHVCRNVEQRKQSTEVQKKQKDYLKKYFLLNFLYSGNLDMLLQAETMSGMEKSGRMEFARMLLVSSTNDFFEVEEEHFLNDLKENLQRQLYYLNLNSNEAVFFLKEKYSDYAGVAGQMYQFFKKKYNTECYFAVSRELKAYQDIPAEFQQMEKMLEEQFYQPQKHVFINGEAVSGFSSEGLNGIGKESGGDGRAKGENAAEEAEVLRRISENIKYKDIVYLRLDFQRLEEKYRNENQFSEMYVKFVFSSILKEIYETITANSGEKVLSKEVDRLYRCRTIQEVLEITKNAVDELECFIQEQNNGFREEVSKVKNYIYHHYEENLNTETLARMVYLSPGYLSAVFKEETGVNMNRFIRDVRMNKAKELLETTNMKITQIAKEVGFLNNSYFGRSFREYFGITPESCRKGKGNDEEVDLQV